MVRIVGVDLPDNKRIEVALTYITGVGRSLSKIVLKQANISPDIKAKELNDEQANQLRSVLQNYQLEGDLRRSVSLAIKRFMDLGNYRGIRHRKKLPVNGQRTKTNARTRKGPVKGATKRK